MYIDPILIFVDYFRSLKLRVAVFEILLPLLGSILLFFTIYYRTGYFAFNDLMNKIISLEGVLVGFSITTITFLTTASNQNIELLKQKPSSVKIGDKTITLFDNIIINFSYSLLLEVIILIVNLTFPFILNYFMPTYRTKVILISCNLFFVIHNLLLNIRNISDIYFTINR
jgi:hypothetical protein